MRKKLVSLTLALALCLGLTIPALAASYTEVVPCKYDWVQDFSEGLAMVRDENYKWGYIDKTGKEVVPCKYESAENFSEGLATVVLDDKYGYIDKTGKEVVPCKYDYVYSFSEGLAAVVLDDKYGYIDKTGKEVVPLKYSYADSFSEGLATVGDENYKWGYIDKTGKEIVPLKYSYADSFSEGLAAVKLNNKWGYIDKTGKEVVPCKYESAENFSEGLAAVGDENYKWGYIDKTGKEVVPCKYKSAENFSEGLAAVRVGDYDTGKWGYIDKTGKEVVPCKYESAENFSEGLAAVVMSVKNEYNFSTYKYGYIDKTGKEVVPCKYDHVYSCFSEGLAAVGLDGKYGYIDKTGKEIVPLKYSGADSFSEGLAAVRDENYKWGYIALSGTAAPEQPEQPASGPQVSDWAKEQVSKAAASGLVPDGLGNDYRVSITRAQFAATAVKLYEAMSGQKAPAAGASPFSDTGDTAVIQAQALGIVSGVGGGKFAPDALVTREQAAAMLSRVYTKLGGTIPEVAATTFADNDKVSGWARDAVAFMSANKIVSGVGSNQFNPKGNASIEQALVIALRMFDNLK